MVFRGVTNFLPFIDQCGLPLPTSAKRVSMLKKVRIWLISPCVTDHVC
jgi:hypothetical protein